MDFTLRIYIKLFEALLDSGYDFTPFRDYKPEKENQKIVILRHDVDIRPENSLKTALIEDQLGIHGTYYFRIVRQSFDTKIIKKIAALGHEIGYHYEDLALAKGDPDKAISLFQKHLGLFAPLYPVQTICMHGSPLSKFDNRMIWKKYKYTDFGIRSEPYFDIDFTKVLYLTDTGRRWDGEKVSVRDKEPVNRERLLSGMYRFRSTGDIIDAARNSSLPATIMLNFHPQRWSDDFFDWSKELIWQGMKNQVKRVVAKSALQYRD
jgi:hypothetical protein